ncbi:hypothetical protein Cni_G09159 [Canna indica]|uniref:RING-type E3 ubiquitin transferase n=1 Tax=Canna indica TaxID=4628 RepID=A0AAQ3K7I5_9LILI|nr:hypothetical protein Cni_G09159 [Canna indica]
MLVTHRHLSDYNRRISSANHHSAAPLRPIASMATPPYRRLFTDGQNITAVLFLLTLLPSIPGCAAQQSAPSPNYFSRNNPANFSPSMATLIVILISAFFFLAFFAVYIRQCTGEVAASQRTAAALSVRFRAAEGLSPVLLESFPTMVYSEAKALKYGHGDLECAVCLSEFEDDEALRLLPGCYHVFHPDCIDSWLASHVTCPVCRSDLSVVSLEPPLAPATASPGPEAADRPPDQVAIAVDRTPTEEEAIELARIGSERREARSRRGRRQAKFPRSHSTGHSLTPLGPEDDGDRYTLRLPDHIRREIFAARKFHRSTSCVAFPVAGEGSSRAGYRNGCTGGDGSSRGGWAWRLGKSDRWSAFLIRTLSAKVPTWKKGDGEGSVKKGEAECSSRGKLGGARTPFDCLGGGAGVGGGGGVKDDGPGDQRGPPQ